MAETFTTEIDISHLTLEVTVEWHPPGRDYDLVDIRPVWPEEPPPNWFDDAITDACVGDRAAAWALALAQARHDRRADDEDDERYHRECEGVRHG